MSLHRASGIFFLIFAAAMYWLVIPAQTHVVYPDGSIPPAVLPTFYSLLIGAFASIVALQSDGETDFDMVQMVKVAAFFLLTTAGVWSMKHLGFEYVAPVMAGLLLWVVGERRPLWLILGAFVSPLLLWAFFEIALGRLLP
jgi:putative tricarboxylic transport membrane protein